MKVEVRGKQVKITGYINTTGRDSKVISHPTEGKFIEQVSPQAFEKALSRTNNVNLVLDHDKSQILASIKQGTLQLFEDSIGLRCIASLTGTNPVISEVAQKAVNKKLKGWSFAFKPIKQRYEELHFRADGVKRRIIEDMELTEVSILSKSSPAYPAQTLEVRTMPLDLDLYFKQFEYELKKLKGGR